MANETCCACTLANDYGTSLASGSGSSANSFTEKQVDPLFKRPALRITLDNQILSAGVATVLSWQTEIFDTASMWSVGLPTDIYLPYAGIYLVGLQGSFGTGAGVKELIIVQNGVEVYRTETNTILAEDEVVYQVWEPSNTGILQAKARSDPGGSFYGVLWITYLGKKV